MENTNVKLVKELRERTQAGFADCQKALEACGNNIEKSIIWLREKGAVKAEKKSGSIAVEGLTCAMNDGKKALIIEVNSQTDFVVKNQDFIKLVQEIEKTIFKSNVTDKDAVEKLLLKDGRSIKEACIELTAKIGEKISFRRAEMINYEKENDICIGSYSHYNGKFASIIAIKGKSNQVIANDIAMHLGALNPKFLNSSSVDKNWLDEQKAKILKKTNEDFQEKANKSGKKVEQKHVEKTVEGRLSKLLAEYCLEDQAFVKEPSISVKKYILNHGEAKLIYMKRFELGEGIEKNESNFAAEVAAQMRAK
ncbi:MAG: translation elongation factor Ts [Mycoplasmoidaceae bacterium]